MRRFVCLAVLLFFTVPFGVSVIGCGHQVTPSETSAACSGSTTTGQIPGQVSNISLSPQLAQIGETLNYGQIGAALSATSTDCTGASVSVPSYIYASSDMSIADINPANGQVCAGTWNRFSGGGIPDYTVCNPPTNPSTTKFVAYLTATAQGATSNIVPVYVHPVVTGVVLGNPTPTASCSTTNDPSSNCCSFNTPLQTNVSPYDGSSCLSQGASGQLTGRVYAGAVSPANNITCKVGRLSFAAQGATNIFTVDASTGLITANQPGTTALTAQIANSGSANTVFSVSTCPPRSITLTATGKTTPSITVPLNNQQAFTTTVTDTKGNPITGLNLEFVSTNSQTIPTAGALVTPAFPGSATISAVCQPGTCNPAPQTQVGLYGTGKPITSNGIIVNTVGNSSSVLYAASTSSQFIYSIDFTTGQASALVQLPHIPNSIVITQDGSSIYMGSDQGLMSFSTITNAPGGTVAAVMGRVLAISPDNGTLVVTDPTRQSISLVAPTGAVLAQTGGAVGTSAKFAPDSQTVYITTTNQQVVAYSTFTGFSTLSTGGINYTDVAVTVPHVGAYFAGGTDTEGRTACATTTVNNATTPPTTTNAFYPVADIDGAHTDRLAATNDGAHIIGASATPAVLSDIKPTYPATALACSTATAPVTFTSSFTPYPLIGITPTAITSVVASGNSSLAFVTYTGAGGLLPAYAPASGAAPNYVKLSGAATAPLTGVFSTDNNTFFVGTSGDNGIHLISVSGTTATDSSTLTPKLPNPSGTIVAPNLIVQRPKRATS